LEELSLKHIKQIEELNNAVKVANINGIAEREDKLTAQVKLGERVGELQEDTIRVEREKTNIKQETRRSSWVFTLGP